MISTKGNSKRGRPKRKNSDQDVSSQQFVKRKQSKKAQKAALQSKKSNENEKGKLKKTLKKNKPQLSDSLNSDSSDSEEIKEENAGKFVNIPIEMFMPDKKFAQILNKANKEPQFLIMLRNLLSGCSRILRDKRSFLNKKWQTLRMSNCTQDEYLSRQAELKRMEVEEIYEIQRDIMSKLSYANIKGFESKENIINDYKHSLMTKEGKVQLDAEYIIEEEVWTKYHDLQKKLLNLLMNEKDLVFSNQVDPIRSNQSGPHREKPVNEENQMDHRINNIETEENQQATQFLFCKHFSEINYERIFDNSSNPFKLSQSDVYYMDPKALGWILETKSDEVYTNEKFQKQTFKRYTQMLNHIYRFSNDISDDILIEKLLEIAAYILNSVHYYQKFKLKCDLLHPLDLLLVIEKIKKDRRNKELMSAQLQQTFVQQLQGMTESMKQLGEPMLQE